MPMPVYRFLFLVLLLSVFPLHKMLAQEAYNTNADSVKHILVDKPGGWQYKRSEQREFNTGGNYYFVFSANNELRIYRTPPRSSKRELFIRTRYRIYLYNNLGQMGILIEHFSGFISNVLYQTMPADQLGTTPFWFLYNKQTRLMTLQYQLPKRKSDYTNEFY
jgi:hypothetical protein